MIAKRKPVEVPLPATPMTPYILMAYLEDMANTDEIEHQAILIQGQEIVNAIVIDGQVHLLTHLDVLNEDPPCREHRVIVHRDGKPPWCHACGLTSDWKDPNG